MAGEKTYAEALGQGLELMMGDNNENAIKEFSEAIRLNPQDAEAYGYRGDCYSATSQYELAVKDFTDAIKYVPSNEFQIVAGYYGSRGVAYKALGKLDLAKQDFEKAFKLDPNNPYKDELAKVGGTAESSVCAKCGADLKGMKFCTKCGTPRVG